MTANSVENRLPPILQLCSRTPWIPLVAHRRIVVVEGEPGTIRDSSRSGITGWEIIWFILTSLNTNGCSRPTVPYLRGEG
jgi:hypothetical protein